MFLKNNKNREYANKIACFLPSVSDPRQGISSSIVGWSDGSVGRTQASQDLSSNTLDPT